MLNRTVSRTFSKTQSRTFATKVPILERLANGPVLGDGGFVFELEKRGYVKAGPWTPEANCEEPRAVEQLHIEFARAGSDVMQTFTFYASEDKLENWGQYCKDAYGTKQINDAACDIAHKVADNYGCLVAGGICQTPNYLSGKGKEAVQKVFQQQCDSFTNKKVDFLIAEYYEHIEETEWAIETCVNTGLVTAANMCIGPEGDMHGTSTGDCGLRMYEAGAKIVGLNCHFDPFVLLEGMDQIKTALERNGLVINKDVYLMVQPLAYMTPDASKQGFIDLPEFPFALEPRILTRWDMQRFARMSWDMGIRYIGGCCGFQPYHIRAVAEELAEERGGRPHEGSRKWEPNAGGLEMHTKPWVRARASTDYWTDLNPSTGRARSSSFSDPNKWGVTAYDSALKQGTERK